VRCVALSIAGSDSSGGAGIQADLKTFHQLGVYGASAVTLLTAQNTTGVKALELASVSMVEAQIEAVFSDLPVAAAKTGALGSADLVAAAARTLRRFPRTPLVVDPVMISKHGSRLLEQNGVEALRRELFPLASLVTPNLPEAELLLGERLASEAERERGAQALQQLGAGAALITGGHAAGDECADVLFDGSGFRWFRAPRRHTPHTHGTGCTYSAAITAYLARGEALVDAVGRAHTFIANAIAGAPGLGQGAGPVDHWASASET
jgi:hydroxymethylpyrimidine/phosphomethylpyrimidine kinase